MLTTDLTRPLTLPSSHRTAGYHLSGLVKLAALDLGMLDDKYADDPTGTPGTGQFPQDAVNRMSLGLAWEDYYAKTVLGPVYGAVYHPKEIYTSVTSASGALVPVYGSPDAVTVNPGGHPHCIIDEIKLTWKSSRRVHDAGSLPRKGEWMYYAQLMGYCYMQQTCYGRLHVYYVNGDYKGDSPKMEVTGCAFTAGELQRNWELLTRYLPLLKPEQGQQG